MGVELGLSHWRKTDWER